MTPLLLSAVSAVPQGSGAGGSLLNWVIPYAAIFGLFYFLFIRPSQKQKQTHEERLRQLKRGDEVITAGGVIGEVVHIKETLKDGAPAATLEDRITIKSAESRIVVERRAIARVLTAAPAEEEKAK